jgi:predicted AlkP superfamily phosphohydrolase/phosphomutase
MSKRKILIIGLDGASFDLVKCWIEQNKLPNLCRIAQSGVWGKLDSVIPYQSITAWTSFMTGKNPAKHGHYNFVTLEPGTRRVLHVNNATTINSKTLWEILCDYNKKLGVMNVPCTYPVKKVNGFMIPDWLTPESEKSPTYPPELASELKKKFGDYLFEYRVTHFEHGLENEQNFLKNLYYTTEKRAESGIFLLKKYEWDFAMVVFTAMDTIQHFYWHHTDSTHPMYNHLKAERKDDEILKFYQKIDQIIGNFLTEVDLSNTRIVILSDHGFGPLIKQVNINKLFENLGLLVLKKHNFDGIGIINFLEKLDFFNLRKHFSRRLRQQFFNWIINPPIEWTRTKAYSGTSCELGIYINLEGRNSGGIVKQNEYNELKEFISEKLLELIDPDTGKKVIERVIKKEDIYTGPYLNEMPDLLLIMAKGYEPVERFDSSDLFISKIPLRRTGWHRLEGIFLAMGEGIKKGYEIKDANIVDICPSLLYMLGIPIPNDMDGKVLDIFEQAYSINHPIEYIKPAEDFSRQCKKNIILSEEDRESQIKDRLRALGYL